MRQRYVRDLKKWIRLGRRGCGSTVDCVEINSGSSAIVALRLQDSRDLIRISCPKLALQKVPWLFAANCS